MSNKIKLFFNEIVLFINKYFSIPFVILLIFTYLYHQDINKTVYIIIGI